MSSHNCKIVEAPLTDSFSASTNSVFYVDSNGARTEITEAVNRPPTEGGGGGGSILDTLRRLMTQRSAAHGRAARIAAMEDDDDDDEDFSYSYRGGRRTAEGLFPKVTEPVEAGVKLERSGLFGMVGNLSAQGTGFGLIPSTAW